MRTKLINYNLGEGFFTFSNNLGVYLEGDTLFLGKEEKGFRCENPERLGNLEKNDIIYINAKGSIKRVYENRSKSIDLMITTHCNSNCIMCPLSDYSRQTNEDGYIKWIKKLIETLPLDLSHICLTGGEPTLIGEDIFSIFDMLKEKYKTVDFQFLTNGRSMGNKAFCDKLVAHLPKNTLIGIPLHAADKDLHDSIAQINGGFGQSVQGIKNLLRRGQKIEIRVVVGLMNAHSLVELAEFIVRELRGVNCVTFMGLEMMGNAVKNMERVWIVRESG